MKLVFNILYGVVITSMIGVGALFLGTLVPVLGVEVKVVKSGSMVPVLPVGSLVIIHKAPSYNVGDIVTFGADTKTQIPTTHRIVDIKTEGAQRVIQTKGDANNAADPTLTPMSSIIGHVVFAIPYLGYILAFARTPWGFGLLVGVPALMIIVEEGYAIVKEIAKMRRKKKRALVAEAVVSPVQQTVVPRNTHVMDGIRRPALRGAASIPVKHIVGGMFAFLLLVGFININHKGDTVAAYQDTEVSAGNKFAAAAVYPTQQVPPPNATASVESEVTTDAVETPPVETLRVDTPFDAPALDALTDTSTDTPPETPFDAPAADTPPADTPPATE